MLAVEASFDQRLEWEGGWLEGHNPGACRSEREKKRRPNSDQPELPQNYKRCTLTVKGRGCTSSVLGSRPVRWIFFVIITKREKAIRSFVAPCVKLTERA